MPTLRHAFIKFCILTICTGNFFLDQDVLEEEGISDFDQYAIDPEATLVSDFFVDDNPEDWIQAL